MHTSLLEPLNNPFYRCLTRHFCVGSIPRESACNLYFNYPEMFLDKISSTECLITSLNTYAPKKSVTIYCVFVLAQPSMSFKQFRRSNFIHKSWIKMYVFQTFFKCVILGWHARTEDNNKSQIDFEICSCVLNSGSESSNYSVMHTWIYIHTYKHSKKLMKYMEIYDVVNLHTYVEIYDVIYRHVLWVQ